MTPEEEAYLKEYTEALPEGGDKEARDAMFQRLSEGDPDAVQTLAACYLRVAADMAVEMNSEDIFLGDLIQEANVSLMQALGGAGEELRVKHGFWENCAKGSRRYWMNRASRNLQMTAWLQK